MLFILSDFDPIQIDNRPKYGFPFPAVFAFCKMNVFLFLSRLNIILSVGR